MFVLTTVEDDIRVEPSHLDRHAVDAITAVIERNYLDKVVHAVGLVVSLYDILSVAGGMVYPSEGAPRFCVRFRLVVFRPFVGEVLVGRIARSDRRGVHVSLGSWFHDVVVPEYALREPAAYDTAEGLWLWRYEDNDMHLEVDDRVRVRVQRVSFNALPPPPELQEGKEEDKVGTSTRPYVPMEVEASVAEDGLGPTRWWDDEDDEAEAEGGAP